TSSASAFSVSRRTRASTRTSRSRTSRPGRSGGKQDMTMTDIPTDISAEDYAARAKEWLAANGPKRGEFGVQGEMGSDEERESIARSKAFLKKLSDAGFGGITYPKEYGGAGLTRQHAAAFNREVAAGGYVLPLGPFYIGQGMCLPTIFTHGTEEQKKRFMPDLINGQGIWSQLFSEPGAGSDVAGLQMRA